MGLYVAKRLIESMGGSIAASVEADDVVSTLHLPLADGAVQQAA